MQMVKRKRKRSGGSECEIVNCVVGVNTSTHREQIDGLMGEKHAWSRR
jgi:hypothetical protein